jgi:hypothetical protein
MWDFQMVSAGFARARPPIVQDLATDNSGRSHLRLIVANRREVSCIQHYKYLQIWQVGHLLDSGRHKILYAGVGVCPTHRGVPGVT